MDWFHCVLSQSREMDRNRAGMFQVSKSYLPNGGKKKEKGKTLSLDEFNSQVDPNAPSATNKEASWADMAPFDPKSMCDKKFWEKDDRSSSYGQRAPAEIDYSKVPDEPPFKAFISNVSYSATREDLKGFFGGKEEIKSLYMSQNDEGNFRGSANIEFFSRDSLLRALQMHGDTMLGRQIRVEVSTSQGGRSGGGGNNSSYRQRTDYTPVGDISDDSWSRGEDFRQAPARDDRSDGVLGSSSVGGSSRYVPPNRRSNFSPTSNFSRQSSQYSYSSDRQSDDNLYRSRGAQDYENNSSNYININSSSRSNAPQIRDDDNYRSYDRYPEDRNNSSSRDYYSNDRRYDTNDRDRGGYNDSRGPRRYDDDRRYNDNRSDRYYSDDRDRDGYGDQRQGDRYGDYQPAQRRDDYPDDRQDSSDYGGYRKSNYDGYDDAYANNNSRSRRSTESDYSMKQNRDRDMQTSAGGRNDMNGRYSEANNDGYGKYRMNSGGANDDNLSNEGHRSRTYSQRSDHFESPRYTLEGDDKRYQEDAKRGYEDDRYTGQREPRERQMSEKEREYEERYERYQNDIREDANHKQYDNRSRTDSGSGPNYDRRYDNRNNNYRGGDGNRGGDRRGGSNYEGYARNDGYYRNTDRRDDRGYDSQRGGGGGYNRNNARDDPYYDRYESKSGYDNNDRPPEGAVPPRKRLELKPRTVAEPPASMPKAAENRPSSIFGNAKPVDTAQREQELAAKRAQKDQQLLTSQSGGAASKGGEARNDVYQPPMRGGGSNSAAANSHASSKSAHYNNKMGGSALGSAGLGGGPRNNFAPLSPERPLDNGVVNKFAVLNTDDDDEA